MKIIPARINLVQTPQAAAALARRFPRVVHPASVLAMTEDQLTKHLAALATAAAVIPGWTAGFTPDGLWRTVPAGTRPSQPNPPNATWATDLAPSGAMIAGFPYQDYALTAADPPTEELSWNEAYFFLGGQRLKVEQFFPGDIWLETGQIIEGPRSYLSLDAPSDENTTYRVCAA